MQKRFAPDGLINVAGGVSGTGGTILAIQSGPADVGAIIGRDVDIVAKQLFANLPVFGAEFYVVQRTCGKQAAVWTRRCSGRSQESPYRNCKP